MTVSLQSRNRARTKIISTVGPACDQANQLSQLVSAGADLFRLNMAHGSLEEHQQLVDRIRKVSDDCGYPIAILVDLAGPKIRLGDIRGEMVDCQIGQDFTFVRKSQTDDPHELTSNYEPLIDELNAGDVVMLADGTVHMQVVDQAPDRVRLKVVQGGELRSRQGIHLPGVSLSVPVLDDADLEAARWAVLAGVDYIGLSFVRSSADVLQLKELIRGHGSDAGVVAKIEKREALDDLEAIVDAADAVMVARGDLGVEIDVAEIAIEQKRIIRVCRRRQKPVIIATQMLDSMQGCSRPTRAEATDVANAILDGADACMLSGETAIGKYPQQSVAMMNRIALRTEASVPGRMPQLPVDSSLSPVHEITRAVVHGACAMAEELGAKLLVVASHSGRTALAVAQHRTAIPTIGVSSENGTLRKMCLYWGVTPLRGAPAREIDALIQHTDNWGCAAGYLQPGDRMVIVGGSHLTAGPVDSQMTAGVHDVVIVHEVEG